MTIRIKKINNTYLQIECEASVAMELQEHFSFLIPNAKFHPLVKNFVWDGRIRLFNVVTKFLYVGLFEQVKAFLDINGYSFEVLEGFKQTSFSINEAVTFIETLNLPHKVRDYQLKAFVHAVRNNRSILVSPTGSGKSLIIYLLARYYNRKTLLVVPTISLVNQMVSDFAEYGYQESCHKIMAGTEKATDALITVSTWQSIFKMPKSFFQQYDVMFGDEVHTFKAKSLITIMENLTVTPYRFGLTGTLDKLETNQMVLEGLFGPIYRVASTVELIDKQHLSNVNIKVLMLGYGPTTTKSLVKADYDDEIDFIISNKSRNKFIKNLSLSLKGNTLILFDYVDKHGKVLYNNIKDESTCSVYFIYGKVDGDERERIRKIVETESNAIIVASSKTFSTGVNIKNLHNLIFASPSKASNRILQSIGRILRLADNKYMATVYDIADDLRCGKYVNHTFKHMHERLKIYASENFKFKIYNIDLGEQ